MIHRLKRMQVVGASRSDVWKYFSSVNNLNEMTPPDMQFEIIHGGDGKMFRGKLIEYRVQLLPMVKSRWLTEISHIEDKIYFVDEQRIGPYKYWHHEHRFDSVDCGTRITDQVTYELPFGPAGNLAHILWVKKKLEHIFDYRCEKINVIFS